MKYLFTLLVVSMAFALNGQNMNPVKFESHIEKMSDTEYVIYLKATAENGWYIYSSDNSGDGPYPTEIDFDTEGGFELVGGIEEQGSKIDKMDPMFKMRVAKYANEVTFKQKIKTDGNLDVIEGYLTYMTCDNSRCLPPTDVEFSFELK